MTVIACETAAGPTRERARADDRRRAGLDRRSLHRGCECGGGDGAAEVVALRVVAVEARDRIEGFLVLDAFSDDLQTEGVGELDGRADDRGAAGIRADAGHERPVELELVDGEVPQVGKGAVAGAVVVDRDSTPEQTEGVEHRAGALRVEHDDAFGDLELERAGRQRVPVDQRRDPVCE